jgi:hypothetical protein
MQINWAKGFFRAWAVLASLWILSSGWLAYTTPHLSGYPNDDCWEQLAKWPDGKPFDVWDRYGFREVNAERKQWQETVFQKVEDCESAKPLMQRVMLRVTENWSDLTSALQLILLPPLVVLIAGLILGWIVRGFRAKQP